MQYDTINSSMVALSDNNHSVILVYNVHCCFLLVCVVVFSILCFITGSLCSKFCVCIC